MGAASAADCPAISHTDLTSALTRSVKASGGATNGGLDFNMWATVVSIDSTVCAIAKSGTLLNDQWLGSRSISAQKASTAIFSAHRISLFHQLICTLQPNQAESMCLVAD